jgi:hypothetical protein
LRSGSGALVLIIGLVAGFPAVAEWGVDGLDSWRSAHLSLIVVGLWVMVTAAIRPALALERRESAALPRSVITTSYALVVAVLVFALTGHRGIEPGGPPANLIAFAGNVVAILGVWSGAR